MGGGAGRSDRPAGPASLHACVRAPARGGTPDPRAFNERDLAVIELALRLMLQGGSAPAEPEMIPAR